MPLTPRYALVLSCPRNPPPPRPTADPTIHPSPHLTYHPPSLAPPQEVTEEDEEALRAFMSASGSGGRTLADVIMEKLRSARAAGAGAFAEPPLPSGLDPKVVEVYRQVGELMHRYKSGRVPKAFKVIPALTNWCGLPRKTVAAAAGAFLLAPASFIASTSAFRSGT